MLVKIMMTAKAEMVQLSWQESLILSKQVFNSEECSVNLC